MQKKDKIQLQNKQLQSEAAFKGKFVDDNPNNFMMQFETTNTSRQLKHRSLSDLLFGSRFKRSKDIEWMEKNGLSKE